MAWYERRMTYGLLFFYSSFSLIPIKISLSFSPSATNSPPPSPLSPYSFFFPLPFCSILCLLIHCSLFANSLFAGHQFVVQSQFHQFSEGFINSLGFINGGRWVLTAASGWWIWWLKVVLGGVSLKFWFFFLWVFLLQSVQSVSFFFFFFYLGWSDIAILVSNCDGWFAVEVLLW